MAKVRVPKELRPPSRFAVFTDPDCIMSLGNFRVVGLFRSPRGGEYYWMPSADTISNQENPAGGIVVQHMDGKPKSPRVILDRLP